MKTYGRVDVKINVAFTSTLFGGEWSASRPGRLIVGKDPLGTNCIRGLVGHRTGLDDVEQRQILILPGLELGPLGRPVRSQSLYRLRYPACLGVIHT
jgi:hypothetical protein